LQILTLGEREVSNIPLQGWKWCRHTAWSADGSHLFAIAGKSNSPDMLLFLDLRGNLRVLAEAVAGEGEQFLTPVASPNGRYVAYQKRTWENNVMMLEHF